MSKRTYVEIRENEKGKFNLYINDHHQGTFGHIWTALDAAYNIGHLCLISKEDIDYSIVDKRGLYFREDSMFFIHLLAKYQDYLSMKKELSGLESYMRDMFKEN